MRSLLNRHNRSVKPTVTGPFRRVTFFYNNFGNYHPEVPPEESQQLRETDQHEVSPEKIEKLGGTYRHEIPGKR